MEALSVLLDQIEAELEKIPATRKQTAMLETEKMYTHYAMQIALEKLGGKAAPDAKEGIMRSRSLQEKIRRTNY